MNEWNTIRDKLASELAPRPDRLAGSLRDTLSMVLALVLMEALRIPGAMLGLALLFLVHRESPVHLVRTAVQILSGCIVANLVAILVVQLSDGSEVVRVIAIVVWIFVAVCGQQTSPWPVFFINTGFYGFLFLSAWDSHLPAGRIVLNNLSDIASLATSLLCFICVDFVFRNRTPQEEMKREMHDRIDRLRLWFAALEEGQGERAQIVSRMRIDMIRAGYGATDRLRELEDHLRNPLLSERLFPPRLQRRVDCLRQMLASAALIGIPKHAPTSMGTSRADVLQTLSLMDLTVLDRQEAPTFEFDATGEGYETEIFDLWLSEFLSTFKAGGPASLQWVPPPAPAMDPWRWQVFFRREARLFALKTTLCAFLCYATYSAIGWPGIVTCVTTVLFTALSTTGAIKEKQVYRFFGSLAGGVLAIASVSLLIPNMDSITALVLLVSPVVFVSAWILRSPRIGYVGLQISYTFFTTLIFGFSASSHIAPARDRIVGIALGCIVMWVVFDQLWPTRSSTALSSVLREIETVSVKLPALQPEAKRQALAQLANHLAVVPGMEDAVAFDFGSKASEERKRARIVANEIHLSVENLLESIELAVPR